MSIQFPNPAVFEVTYRIITDAVTQTEEDQHGTIYAPNVEAALGGGGWVIGWDDDDAARDVILTNVTDEGGAIIGTSTGGSQWRIREPSTYDALALSSAGVPQPLAAVKAQIIRGGVLADQMDAVVAPDNTVATLMLETGIGTFVRYSGDWQKLSTDSDSLDGMSLVEVAPGALDVWDAADSADQSISIFDLPMPDGQGGVTTPEGEPDVETTAAMAASGISIPTIGSVEDLDLGVRYGNTHPAARWYVTKRASALNASGKIPAHWNVAWPVVLPFPIDPQELMM